MNNTIQSLQWRYATKKFDAQKKLTAEQFHAMTEALRLSPSSFGLQPWKFIVVHDVKTREKLKAVAWNQSQVTDASHLIVIAVPKEPNGKLVDAYVEFVKREHERMPKGAFAHVLDSAKLLGMATMMKGFMSNKTAEGVRGWVRNQAYIALGTLLTAAAAEKIDACPMEGFDSAKFDEILGLHEKGLESCVCVALGFRAADDKHASEPKLRYPESEVFIEI